MINWKNDPLLYGKKYEYVIDKDEMIINVFRCLIRPEDFVDKNFLLRTPYVTGNELIQQFNYFMRQIGDNALKILLRGVENYCNFEYSTFYKVVYRYKQMLRKDRINLVILRTLSLALGEISGKSDIRIFIDLLRKVEYICEDTGRKIVKLPLTLNELLTNQNIYLAGVIIGDGHLDKQRSEIIIADGHTKKEFLIHSKKFMKFLSNIFARTFKINGYICKEGNCWKILVHNKWVLRFFNHFFQIPVGTKSDIVNKPKILDLKKDKEGLFWKGLFDTDGGLRSSLKGIRLKSNSKKIIEELDKFCSKTNIEPIRRTDSEIYITSKDILKFANNIGFCHPRKAKRLLDHLTEGPKYLELKGVKEGLLTKTGYYDLAQSQICVYGMGTFFHEIRSDLDFTLKKMGEVFGLSKKRIWRFEKEKVSIPISILVKANGMIGHDKDETYRALESNDVRFCVPRMKNSVKLPLRLTKESLRVISCLRPYSGSTVYIRLSENLETVDGKTIERRLMMSRNCSI